MPFPTLLASFAAWITHPSDRRSRARRWDVSDAPHPWGCGPALLPAVAMLLCLGGAAGTAAANEAVLLTSTAPSYAPGMVVTSSDRLQLPDGASVTLLFRSGQMLRLRGPLDASMESLGGASGDAGGSVVALAEMLRLRGADATVIGGTRAMSVVRARPAAADDVLVDPMHSGTYCLRASDTVWIARPSEAGEQYGLRRRGSTRMVAWPPGAMRIEWPADVPIEDGDRFEITAADGTSKATITFRLMELRPTSDAAWVAEGMLRGCREQFEAALRRLARAAVPPELWLTADRGRNPVYASGEPIRLTVKAGADGYLYCVAVHADATAVPVFPAGAIDGARLSGATPVTIPGHRRSAELRAGPRGAAQIRCWLADRDISPELPHALLDPSAAPLPDRMVGELDAVFGRIAGGHITAATLDLRVE